MPITLLPLDVQSVQQVADGNFSGVADAANAAAVTGIIQELAAMQTQMYAKTGADLPWIGYLAKDGDGRIVGMCSFKGSPAGGVVEIAYTTFPEYEGQGWGGDMATALVDIALGEDGVETIVAHTLPGDNPSTKILDRLGFEHATTLEDPEDGAVWRWVLERE